MTVRVVKPGRLRIAICVILSVSMGTRSNLAVEAVETVVGTAIRNGASYIERRQLHDGSWQARGHQLGETALAGLALLAARYPAHSPAVAAAARAVRQLAPRNSQTYDVALAVMFLDQVGAQADSELIRNLGSRLAAGQAANGSWSYSLVGAPGNGDNSNAQFAALACWICRRHGAAMEDAVIKADRYFRSSVNRTDGGWGYTPGAASTPTMVCAGLVALAAERGLSIERNQVQPAGKRKTSDGQDGPPRDLVPDNNDPVLAAALGYLAAQLQKDRIESQNKPFAGLYFYWSLERVGVIYGLTRIREIDWYNWGTERLLRLQRQDGGWGGQDCVDTAFAVLFLSKANVAQDLTQTLGGLQQGELPLPQPPMTDTFLRVERKRPSKDRETNTGMEDTDP